MEELQLSEELFLPEPLPRDVKYTVISVDDHVVEPPHTFEGRLPAHLQDRAPAVIDTPQGQQIWKFEDELFTQAGMNAIAGRRPTQRFEPFRFDQMRPSCYDVDARVRDMDINGVWAAVNFPSMITGSAAGCSSTPRTPSSARPASVLGTTGSTRSGTWRIPPASSRSGIAFLSDPETAVAEIHRNADRGFTGISMPERPHLIGLPTLWDRAHWDPIFRACVETDTVVSLHVGSSGGLDIPQGAPGLQLGATLFGQLSLASCAEWLWSGYPYENPTLKIAMSEGGIGWVAMLLDRLDNLIDRSGYGAGWDERPADVVKRNFSFCTIDDPSTIDTRHRIGVENIMMETDFPHGDGTWPDTQLVIEKLWGHIPNDELRMMCCENAAKLYRHPLPEVVLPL